MSTEEMPVPGGWSEEKLVTPEVKEICMKVKPEIQNKTGANFMVYTPLSFRQQIVSGTNYLVKVVVSVEKCFHALIFAALPCYGGELTVTDVQFSKALTDPLVPF